MRMSANGLAFLSREEGLKLVPYNDSVGHATIGVGHLLHRGRVTDADRRRYRGFTRADAIRLFKRDLAPREAAVERMIDVPTNENEFDALVSLDFNIGEGGFAGSTVRRELNRGRRHSAANAFLMWRIPPELIGRRRRERALFLRPGAKPDPLRFLGADERRWCRELDKLRRENRDVGRRKELVAAMTIARKRIYVAAEKSGGFESAESKRHHRGVRYHELRKRTV